MAELQLAGDVQAIRALATRVADLSGPDYLAYLAEWLEHFRAGGDEGLRGLLTADRVRHAALGPAGDMAWLLEHLVAAGADDLARALLGRDPGGQADLDDLRDVARLIAALRDAGAGEAAGILARRAAGAGMFGVFLAYHSTGTDTGGAVSYRYGCEPDLTSAPPWRWAPPGPGTAGSGPAR